MDIPIRVSFMAKINKGEEMMYNTTTSSRADTTYVHGILQTIQTYRQADRQTNNSFGYNERHSVI